MRMFNGEITRFRLMSARPIELWGPPASLLRTPRLGSLSLRVAQDAIERGIPVVFYDMEMPRIGMSE